MNKSSMQIKTSSNLGSNAGLKIGLIGPGIKRKWVGSIRLFFYNEPKYQITRCTLRTVEEPFTDFPEGLVTGLNDVFDIQITDGEVIIHCNGVVILDYKFSEADVDRGCIYNYRKSITGVRFWNTDSASVSFRAHPEEEGK